MKKLTKARALKLMLECGRELVEPKMVEDIAKVFGTSLKKLGLKPQKTSSFRVIPYKDCDEELGVSMYEFAQKLVLDKKGINITSEMNGIGSYAEDITKQAVRELMDFDATDDSIFNYVIDHF